MACFFEEGTLLAETRAERMLAELDLTADLALLFEVIVGIIELARFPLPGHSNTEADVGVCDLDEGRGEDI